MGAACSCSKGSVSVAPEEAVAEPAAAAAPAPRADGQKRLHKANRRGSVGGGSSCGRKLGVPCSAHLQRALVVWFHS